MTENLSALVDEEIDESSQSELLEELCRDPLLQQRWRRYHLIRSAIRGECSLQFLRQGYVDNEDHTEPVESLSSEAPVTPQKIRGFFERSRPRWMNWAGGFGLAAGLSTAAVVGFVSGTLVDFQLIQQQSETVEITYNDSGPTRWVIASDFGNTDLKSVDHLNQTLLAHSENSGYSSMNGISNYARLVAYDR